MFKGSHLLILIGAIALASAFFCHRQSRSLGNKRIPESVVQAWAEFKTKYGKTYATPMEEAFRLMTFYKHFEKIALKKSTVSHQVGINHFHDLTMEEFKAKYLGYKPNTNEAKQYNTELLNAVPSNDADWRTTTGVVTPIKDQKQCGSCWAFSATGALEGVAALFAQKPGQSFSEQQLVDCSRKYGNDGCDGGLMNQAFQFVIDNGIETEAQYPYKARDQICKSKVGDFKVNHFVNVPPKSSGALAAACDKQPISVAIEADEIMDYKGGIFADKKCGDSLDHGVLLVGYTSDYWIVKNSWGVSWGEQGYIRMSRSAIPDSKGGICGILTAASYPTM